jgi:hypothetical protein
MKNLVKLTLQRAAQVAIVATVIAIFIAFVNFNFPANTNLQGEWWNINWEWVVGAASVCAIVCTIFMVYTNIDTFLHVSFLKLKRNQYVDYDWAILSGTIAGIVILIMDNIKAVPNEVVTASYVMAILFVFFLALLWDSAIHSSVFALFFSGAFGIFSHIKYGYFELMINNFLLAFAILTGIAIVGRVVKFIFADHGIKVK